MTRPHSHQQEADENVAAFHFSVASKTHSDHQAMVTHGQCSQFRRVIIPVTNSPLLDCTLLYTCATRANAQLILVGEVAADRAAVETPEHASSRQVPSGAPDAKTHALVAEMG